VGIDRCWVQAKARLRNQLKLSGPRDLGHAHFQGNYLCESSAFPIQSRIPNSKSLAQVVFEILRSKCIGVTSLTFHGHVTSSVMWPFDSPCAISYWWTPDHEPTWFGLGQTNGRGCDPLINNNKRINKAKIAKALSFHSQRPFDGAK